MARPSKSAVIDLGVAHDLTAGLIDRLACPAGKAQAFLRDTKAPALRVRVTTAGAKSYVFEAKLKRRRDGAAIAAGAALPAALVEGLAADRATLAQAITDVLGGGVLDEARAAATHAKANLKAARAAIREAAGSARQPTETVRRTIGDVRAWSIEAARAEANRLRVLVDNGMDPRELERQQEAARQAQKAAGAAEAVTVREAWDAYLLARKQFWGARHYADHVAKAKAGGEKAKRGTRGRGVTVAGPLHPLMALKLRDLTPAAVAAWAAEQAQSRPTVARLSWRLLKGFLGWCAEQEVYASVLPAQNPAKGKAVRELLGKSKVKQDALQREQLEPWFAAVRQLPNATAAAYLQTLLLTGARPGEVLALRWEDVNEKWKGLTIRDKVEGERVIPLTPYVAHLLAPMPRVNQWVFASPSREPELADKPLSIPRNSHQVACKVAGIEGLTLHGLRRSFKSLTEWLEMPAGVVAQIMGHKPSATAEKHYTVRPLDLLRMHHERIEAWILEQAGIEFVPEAKPGKLVRVK